MRQIPAEPFCIQARFVHADQTDRREMILKCSEISLRIRVQTFIQQFCNDCTFDMERSCRNIHHPVESLIEFFHIIREICYSRHIDRHDTY